MGIIYFVRWNKINAITDISTIIWLSLEQANDSLIKQKITIINFRQENKHLKDENQKLKQQIYIDTRNGYKDNEIKFGL